MERKASSKLNKTNAKHMKITLGKWRYAFISEEKRKVEGEKKKQTKETT